VWQTKEAQEYGAGWPPRHLQARQLASLHSMNNRTLQTIPLVVVALAVTAGLVVLLNWAQDSRWLRTPITPPVIERP
jgi:hypothetical protein